MAPLTQITSHGWQIGIDPACGGQIARCDWDGQPVLKPAREGHWPENMQGGCFALLPFSNRIRNGAFDYNGRPVRLAAPDFGMPHALHGYGWRHSWHITRSSADAVDMVLEHDAGDWPWSYRAHQAVRAGPGGLTLSLCIENLSRQAMPAGIGFHPYFPRRNDTRIKMDCEGCWLTDPAEPGLPVTWRPLSPATHQSHARPASGIDLDNCFTGWNRHVQIAYPDTSLLIVMRASEPLGNLVVFCPAGQDDILCLEPVSHVTDAINLPDLPAGQAMDPLAPGKRLCAEIQISAQYAR